MHDTARDILASARQAGCEILLPQDVVVADHLARDVPVRTVSLNAVPPDTMILDVGPATVQALVQRVSDWRTLVWNGPLGAFETPPFDVASVALARAVAAATEAGRLVCVAGGGDTVAVLNQAGVSASLTYVSTAGGAFLEWLEGRTLPGVAALDA